MENLGLLFAIMFVLSQLLLPFSTQEDIQSNATCPENFSFQCGNLGWLKFPCTNLSYPNCGLLLVDCSAEPLPKMALGNQRFQVKSIWNSGITLEFLDLQSHWRDLICDSFYNGMSLPKSPSISFTILNNITLFRCHQKIDSLYGYPYYDGCRDFIYYANSSNSPTPGNISACTVFNLPMNTKKISENNESDDPELFRLLAAEFDLQWHLSDDCYDCHRRGGICQPDWSEKSRCTNATNGLGTG